MKTMKSVLLAAYLTLSVSLGASEQFPLRDLPQSVDRLLSSDNPEQSELAYLAARGTALYLTIAIVFEENGNGGERDKKLIANMRELSEKHHKVALISGLLAKKNQDSIKEQIQSLMEVYAKEMVQSKKLNNEYFSPIIVKDMEGLKKIQPLIFRLYSDIIKESKN